MSGDILDITCHDMSHIACHVVFSLNIYIAVLCSDILYFY